MPLAPPQCPPAPDRRPHHRPPPPPSPQQNVDPKLQKFLKKYPYNWRITQLSRPVRIAKKFVPKKVPIGYIEPVTKPGALKGKIPERTKDAKTIPLWKLKLQKNYFKTCRNIPKKQRKKRFRNLNAQTKKTWNSVYYYYRKALAAKKKKEAAAKASADAKSKKKTKSKAERLKEAIERCKKMAVPKPVFKPTPKPRKVVKDWNSLLVHLDVLSEPTRKVRKYKRPSLDSQYVDPTKVSPKALKYKITSRVDDLAHKLPERFTRKEKPYTGAVKRGALKFKITPRIEEISAPKKRADAPEMDVKENPFAVSKNALKYKPTPRIEELAKPVERR